MEQRKEFVTLASQEGANIRELCRRYEISPPTGYKWLERDRNWEYGSRIRARIIRKRREKMNGFITH